MTRLSETVYETLIDEEDARACADIPDQACRELPGNFLLIVAAQFFTKLGDAIASPKTVLAWVMGAVQAPVALTSFLVPIRESGSLIPQLAIAGWVRRFAVRKWFWVAGSVVQAAAVAAIGLTALVLEGTAAGLTILALLTVFSLARGFCSVASKDVVGKTVPKRRRGRLTGWSASVAGLAAIAIGLGLLLPAVSESGSMLYAALLAGAGMLWLIGAAIFSRVVEFEGETAGGRNGAVEAYQRARLLLIDTPFRRFVLTRALLLCSALSAPYYILLARERSGTSEGLLGLFIVAAGLASLVSAPVWGRFADRSSRRVMIVAATISGSVGLLVFAVVELWPALAAQTAFFPVAYFVLSVAHDGVRVGRKTYVVDLAQGNRRTDYVSVSNTAIGFVLLATGLIGALSSITTISVIVLLLSMLGLAGAMFGTRLREVE